MNYKIPKSMLNPDKKNKSVSVRVNEEQDEIITKLAQINNITKSEVLLAGIQSLIKK